MNDATAELTAPAAASTRHTTGEAGPAHPPRPVAIPPARERSGRPVGLVAATATNPPSTDTAAQAREASAATPAAPPAGRLAAVHAPYFVQRQQVGCELVGRNRVEVFRQICQGRRVLHVGCADWPITDVQASLHVQLDAVCAQLDGFDVHPDAFEVLQPYVRGKFFSRWEEVTSEYDLIIAPEVLEHVPDVQGFLQQLDAVKAPHVLLTVPDASQCASRHFEFLSEGETFVEVVHPDHNCWYSPYTLGNVIRKYTDWQLAGMWFFNRISLLTIATKPGPSSA